jgi:hypothetical protein
VRHAGKLQLSPFAMALCFSIAAPWLTGCASSSLPHHDGVRLASSAKVNPVTPPDGGGEVPLYPDPCPDCSWNPEISNAMPSDQGQVSDPSSACLELGVGYDAYDQACFNGLPKIKWHFSRTVYGQCSGGNYLYVNGGYDLGCQAPLDSPTGLWYITATLTTLGAFQIVPIAPTTYQNGQWFDVEAIGPQSAFTNLHLCFHAGPSITAPCLHSGGGLSVGFYYSW